MALVYTFSIFFLLILCMQPSYTIAQTYSNVSLGSFLTAANDNSSWLSPSGEFAFGFQQIGAAGFLLAIWFDQITEKTIIWSANGNNPVQRGSRVELTTDGQLVLSDTNGTQIWAAITRGAANSVTGGVVYAAMLETGNFVLANQNSVNLWESFNTPTDTMLPGQILKQDSMLVSRLSETNYSSGRFRFIPQNDGNLVLYVNDFAYWDTKTNYTSYQVIFNKSGFIYLAATNGSVLELLTSNPVSAENFYQRAVLEYDGVFRQYIYPRATSSGARNWSLASNSYIPSNLCYNMWVHGANRRVREMSISPYCGLNSYCMVGNDNKPACRCPPGYSLLDPQNETNGCKQDFSPQSCSERIEDSAQLFDLTEVPNMDVPLFDYSSLQVNENSCREDCLNDCFCAVAIFRDGTCLKKFEPFSYGWINPNFTGNSLIKIRKDPMNPTGTSVCQKDSSIVTHDGLLGSSISLNAILLIATVIITSRLIRRKSPMVQPCLAIPRTSLQNFTYKELQEATDGFKEELGRGASATVYKGVLAAADDRKFIAVKHLEKIVREGEQEFKAELSAIGRTNHKNLVNLLGFCNEEQHRLLVYEFMSNSTLSAYLFGPSRPSWSKRMQIALGIAKGLHYLHEDCSTRIIHCDIKPQNILLDDSYTARISDFGLAKLLKIYQTHTTTGIRGTNGYVAPEWFKKDAITSKVDVYSFGVLLLEIVCCRRNVEKNLEEEDQIILVDWAYDKYKEGRLDLLIENDMEAMNDIKRVEKLVLIAIGCIQEDPFQRPFMNKVMQLLQEAIEDSVPLDTSLWLVQ